jgi:hypothetical protein
MLSRVHHPPEPTSVHFIFCPGIEWTTCCKQANTEGHTQTHTQPKLRKEFKECRGSKIKERKQKLTVEAGVVGPGAVDIVAGVKGAGRETDGERRPVRHDGAVHNVREGKDGGLRRREGERKDDERLEHV